VRIDSLGLRMRPRSPYEAADLGVRLCQHHWRSLYACHAVVTLPMLALCVATYEIAAWLPLTLIFLAKPWLDRTSVFVLSRAAFGQQTRLADLWAAQRQVLWSQFLLSWTWRRLSPWRAFSQPVYQLEGLRFGLRRRRLAQLRDVRDLAGYRTGVHRSLAGAITT
jgi:ABC-type amino acid transport substrate-binding protein